MKYKLLIALTFFLVVGFGLALFLFFISLKYWLLIVLYFTIFTILLNLFFQAYLEDVV